MDLDLLKTTGDAQPLKLVHPVSGVELEHDGQPVVLHIVGPDADPMKKLDRVIQNRRLKSAQRTGRVSLSAEELEAEGLSRLVTSITGWDNVHQGGKPLKYSPENAKILMTEFAWMRDQVEQFGRDAGNFVKSVAN